MPITGSSQFQPKAQPAMRATMASTDVSASDSTITITDANGCTRTVEYRSRGSGAEPKITRASAGNCDAVRSNPQPLEAGAVNADPAPPLSEQV